MSIHNLKCLQPYFNDVDGDRKTFEVRINDRNFQVGDVLRLHEWHVEKGFTGFVCERVVTYVFINDQFLQPGYVVLGLKRKRRPFPL